MAPKKKVVTGSDAGRSPAPRDGPSSGGDGNDEAVSTGRENAPKMTRLANLVTTHRGQVTPSSPGIGVSGTQNLNGNVDGNDNHATNHPTTMTGTSFSAQDSTATVHPVAQSQVQTMNSFLRHSAIANCRACGAKIKKPGHKSKKTTSPAEATKERLQQIEEENRDEAE